jgi:hypothetical protein
MPVAVETADVLTKLGIHDGYKLVSEMSTRAPLSRV